MYIHIGRQKYHPFAFFTGGNDDDDDERLTIFVIIVGELCAICVCVCVCNKSVYEEKGGKSLKNERRLKVLSR